ncbi:hypothetical protein CNMCM6106_007682 [Aspergillus hiratsukae]|uniref:Uncharacterized protein n=1 Tax=Aspergillus hiratsukae TaxID=1194566 RepID=A0A8H6QJY9_9EURO|nr:hypothetical protein CNMCM6106_007682 [Aspergillus hiratsukae]
MMALILLTPLFDFLVGSEKRTVTIQQRSYKETLASIVGPHQQRQDERVHYQDSLSGGRGTRAFLRFTEFAYRGRYTTPSREDGVLPNPLNDLNATLLEEQNYFYYDEGEAMPGSRCPYQAFWEHFLIQRLDGEEASENFAPDLIFHA